jgi:putative ABC transport system permease protein
MTQTGAIPTQGGQCTIGRTSSEGAAPMWVLTAADLRMRLRQFSIATIGATLVFAMTLVMAGLSGGFRAETRQTVGAVGGTGFIVPVGAGGPFTNVSVMPGTVVEQVRRLPGVLNASPMLIFPQRFHTDHGLVYGHVVGGIPGGIGGAPVPGLHSLRHGEAVVDDLAKVAVGDTFLIGPVRFHAVRKVHGYSVLGGLPNIYVSVADARAVGFSGRDIVTTVAVRGTPKSLPHNLTLLTNKDARDDVLRQLGDPIRSIDIVQFLLWIVAGVIIGAVVYLSSIERTRDFAVLKAIGSSSGKLYVGLATQAVAVALIASGLGNLFAPLLGKFIPIPLAIPGFSRLLLPAVAIAVGLVASLAGLRSAVRVDPAQAFANA